MVVIANAVAGAWALGAHRSVAAARPGAVVVHRGRTADVFVQVILGVVLVNRDGYPLPQFHAFYGFVAIATVGIIYSYRSQLRHRLYLLYGGGGLFIMGLAIRAMVLHR